MAAMGFLYDLVLSTCRTPLSQSPTEETLIYEHVKIAGCQGLSLFFRELKAPRTRLSVASIKSSSL